MMTVSIDGAVFLMLILLLMVGCGAYGYGRFTSQRKYLHEILDQRETIARLRLLNRMQAQEDDPALND